MAYKNSTLNVNSVYFWLDVIRLLAHYLPRHMYVYLYVCVYVSGVHESVHRK